MASKYDNYKKNNDMYGYDLNGKKYYLNFTGDGFGDDSGYNVDDFSIKGQKKHLAIATALYFELGRNPNKEELYTAFNEAGVGGGRSSDVKGISGDDKGAWENIIKDLEIFKSKNNIDDAFVQEQIKERASAAPQDTAFNEYYNDLYSLEEGTGGRALYDNLGDAYVRQADADLMMADTQFQSQAMLQAQTVKNITDQVRAERMSRLRAGMSQAQIANQDMQMMMTNVNSLNENARMMNQQRSQAQVNKDLARDQAYMEYLNQVNARGQNAAAMYAADSGNANWNALRYAKNTGEPYKNAYGIVTGLDDKNKN